MREDISMEQKKVEFNIPEELQSWGENADEQKVPGTTNTIHESLVLLPSVPLSLKSRFFPFWELLPFGNYDKRDIEYLKVKFKKFLILELMKVPRQEWNRILRFEGITPDEGDVELTVGSLHEMLEMAFYIQLTRGKKGTLMKLVSGYPLPKEEKEKKLW